jgi:hypothetical protein
LADSDNEERKIALIILLCAIPFAIPFWTHGDTGRATAAVLCADVFGTTIWLCRHLWRRIWFWVVLAILAAAHVPLILFVHWSFPGVGPQRLMGVAVIDLAYVYGPIWFIEEALSSESKIS